MAKIFGILLIVAGIWVGLEVMNHGMDGAFGGLFASGASEQAPDGDSLLERTRGRVGEAYEAQERRAEGRP